jgi:hypothetical protein
MMDNKILTWENLQRRGHQGPGICVLCHQDSESTLHLMMECRFSQHVWTETLAAHKLNFGWYGLNLQNIFKDWCLRHPLCHMIPSIVCWKIWLERNSPLFEEDRASTASVIHTIMGWLGRTKEINQPSIKSKNPPLLKNGRPLGWFDGVAQRGGQICRAGGVIRVNNHTKYKWMLNCGPGTNTREELLGVWPLLSLVIFLHIYDLQVVGDSKIIIDWLNRKCDLQVLGLAFWKDRIKALILEFLALDFSHTYRAFNQEADELSKQALEHPEGRLTYLQMEDGLVGPNLFLNLY